MSRFPPHLRQLSLAQFGEVFDVLVVGGGITGCGVLLEAAQRGLSALLVEREDLASGTSSRSSKLIHGGLRYLRGGHLHLTRQACHERDRMLDLDPHLVRPQPFIYPVRRGDPTPAWAMSAGLWLYDRFTTSENRHRRLVAGEARQWASSLNLEDRDQAFLYHDGRADDALLTRAVAATAVQAGGLLVTRCSVEEITVDSTGRANGAVVRDLEDDRTHEVTARVVVNAAGVWADEVRRRSGASESRLRPSRGSHLVLAADRLALAAAVAAPSPDDGRPVFFIPHPEGILVGTTDLYHEGPLDDPRPTPEEVAYLLRAADSLFPDLRLGSEDVVGTFAGLRPIPRNEAKGDNPSKVSRDEVIWEERGLVTVTGGKLTTWRPMAEAAVERVLTLLPPERVAESSSSLSSGTVLAGRAPLALGRQLSQAHDIPEAVAEGAARRLLMAAAWLPTRARDPHDLRPLMDGLDLCAAEVRLHLDGGLVLRLEDFLLRRVRLGLWDPAVARDLVPRLRPLFEETLGWDDARWSREEETCDAALEAWRPLKAGYIQTVMT